MKPILATAIETTPEVLISITEVGRFSISWDKCSERLAHVPLSERSRAELSPSGYGVHWPLLDEDLQFALYSAQSFEGATVFHRCA
ncbi:MAG: DUF2442 domain-containing protein [Bryobacteraceae bacterium]